MKKYLALLASLLLITACSDENSKIRGEFIAGCMNGGSSKTVCTCTFEKLETKYSPSELQAINHLASPTESFLREAVQLAKTCRTQQN
ncbi:hypothetical protein [Pseudomonas oryzihabitans]|uniref:hypothetical protein n=1 Tax=Pseudomonas oryzihabitans TaxID=47885 RepID=UPI0021D8CDC8|nr:hypothetical protein [Pseudomonas oryzihabitans]